MKRSEGERTAKEPPKRKHGMDERSLTRLASSKDVRLSLFVYAVRDSTRVDGLRKGGNIDAIKMQVTNRRGEGGERARYTCDARSGLRLGGKRKRGAKTINGVKKKLHTVRGHVETLRAGHALGINREAHNILPSSVFS